MLRQAIWVASFRHFSRGQLSSCTAGLAGETWVKPWISWEIPWEIPWEISWEIPWENGDFSARKIVI